MMTTISWQIYWSRTTAAARELICAIVSETSGTADVLIHFYK